MFSPTGNIDVSTIGEYDTIFARALITAVLLCVSGTYLRVKKLFSAAYFFDSCSCHVIHLHREETSAVYS